MSSYKVTYTVLTCDAPGCDTEFEDSGRRTNAEARKAARKHGWTYQAGHPTVGDNKDFCPDHGVERAR